MIEASKILGVQPVFDSSVTKQPLVPFTKVDFTILGLGLQKSGNISMGINGKLKILV